MASCTPLLKVLQTRVSTCSLEPTCWVRNVMSINEHHVLRRAPTGHFYLTKLLLPVLTATAKKSPGAVRVVNVSSFGHNMGAPEGIRWPTVTPGNDSLEARKQLGTNRLYGQSKLVSGIPPQLVQFGILIRSFVGQYPILERTRSAIRW